MPVYHFTLHAYRNWRPDNRRGYVHHTRGLLKPDPKAAERYDADTRDPAINFDGAMQAVLIRATADVCHRAEWRFYSAGTDPTHLHLLISWPTFDRHEDLAQRLKGNISFTLGRDIGPRGRRWFTRGQSERRVFARPHFDYLVGTYLPDHRGVLWREGPLPESNTVG